MPCLPEQVSSCESGTINSSTFLDAGGVHRESVAFVLSVCAGPEIQNKKKLEILYLSPLVQRRSTPVAIQQP